ncbi:hypothetical protein J3R30DRAFT_70335 [Lentinula aciculospora]|uniref:Uncharacterized protein n=1 Tax=Lentinula aciculospora TaxID=153920 RepID=A0A9W9DYT3_9AGAR|nr:hypothetical protein J3R30DRAFT_70335 [Lentinula aciculospora]
MPNLSTFISYGKALRKPKGFNALRHFDSTNSPQHPYASADVIHITPTQSLQSYEEDENAAQLPFQSPSSSQLTPVRPSTPPKKLDVELPSDSMSDWIPSHLLDEGMYNGDPSHQSPGASSSKLPEEHIVHHEGFLSREDEEQLDDDASVYEDDDDYSSTSSNDSNIVANLEAMNASSFVKTNEKPPRGSIPSFKRTAPSPIQIPHPSMHGPKVQIIRSSGGSKGTWHTSSRPDSMHSGDEYSASAVSGTTLARALIGNTFVLSSDERAARYQSWGSVLTRTDSATLPRDETPFFSPPMSHSTPDNNHSLVPLPPNADSVYIPPKNPRRISDARRKRQSTGSLIPRSDSEGELSLGRSSSIGLPPPTDDQQSQSVLSISETETAILNNKTSLPNNENIAPPSASDSLNPLSPYLSPNPGRPTSRASSDGGSSNRPTSSTSSGKDYDTMLDDYYANADPMSPASPETVSSGGHIPFTLDSPHFRPPFSPITEESSSQLSPPTPYRRDSKRHTGNTGSPNGPRATRSTQRLLPIGESPQQNEPTSPEPNSASSSVFAPPVFSFFNRQRSGSAPNPIKIVRDSQDLTSFNLISTRPISTSSSPTSSHDYSHQDYYAKQTFPETPNAFSPIWSASSLASPGVGSSERRSEDQILIAVPPTPMTAAGEPMPALAHHMLARAASSVRGARHTRQLSINRARTVAQHPYVSNAADRQIIPPPIPPSSEPEINDEETTKRKAAYPSWVTQKIPNSGDEPSPSLNSDTVSPIGSFQSPATSSILRDDSMGEVSVRQDELPINNSSQLSLTVRGLPPLPPSPSIYSPLPGQPPGLHEIASTTSLVVSTHNDATSSSQDSVSGSAVPSSPRPFPSVPAPQHLNYAPASADSSTEVDMEISASIPSLGSPPPYYTLVFDQGHGHGNSTPTSGGSNLVTPNTPPSSRAESSRQSVSSIGARRGRSRPPLPLGPRRPSHTALNTVGRQRNGSITSLNSNAPKLLHSTSSAPHSPRFQSPAPKWRGYTMDAAKWTFTSSQLQAVVSRAIRQSAEASAIRLLRLETVDHDIPVELHRLELQRTDIKTRYKMLTRRRTEVLATLTLYCDGTLHEDPTASLRIISELRDISSTLDRLAEDLHSVDEQISQLTSLRDVHDASALAMAIRKLNASFLKQLAVSDALRSQMVALEAERDDAWKQAETMAHDFDRLNEKVDNGDASSSNRQGRVTAMRKSSIRVSKAGLRSSRSSMSSTHRLSSASFSGGMKSAFSVEDIPPVPPIPRRPHRPVDISTDLPSTRSFIALSTDGPTPNTETRAIYEELCDMLGIPASDFRPRRSQSVIERTRVSAKDKEIPASSKTVQSRSSTSGGRPLSMPDRSGLTEVYQNMSADGDAMLATLGLLSAADTG